MKRRDVLKTALLGGGAALAGEAHTARPQPAVSAAASAASSAETARPSAWKPLLFDEHQNQTVITLTDLIIPATDTPGAVEARVNEYIDLIFTMAARQPAVTMVRPVCADSMASR